MQTVHPPLKPVPHDTEVSVPKPPIESKPENSSNECQGATGMDNTNESEPEGPNLLDQTDLNDLNRDGVFGWQKAKTFI